MLLFALESVFTGMSFNGASTEEVSFWQTLTFLVRSFLPGRWFCFSLTYSRGNYREFLVSSRFLLLASFSSSLSPLCAPRAFR